MLPVIGLWSNFIKDSFLSLWKLKANVASNISPTISLTSSGSRTVPGNGTGRRLEAWQVSLSRPPWSPPPSAALGRGQAGHTLSCSVEDGSSKFDVDSFLDFPMCFLWFLPSVLHLLYLLPFFPPLLFPSCFPLLQSPQFLRAILTFSFSVLLLPSS